jgi:hypothetical protein
MMEQLEQYEGHIIRAFEQRPGIWLAEIRKQDGSVERAHRLASNMAQLTVLLKREV